LPSLIFTPELLQGELLRAVTPGRETVPSWTIAIKGEASGIEKVKAYSVSLSFSITVTGSKAGFDSSLADLLLSEVAPVELKSKTPHNTAVNSAVKQIFIIPLTFFNSLLILINPYSLFKCGAKVIIVLMVLFSAIFP
jgi:hypothetical protein